MKKEKAKRWKVNEGVKALRDGDVKARMDIATRFPMFATATLEEIVAEVTLMTVRQVEIRLKKKLLKGHIEDTDEEDDDTGEDEKEVIKKQPAEPVEEVETEVIEKNSTADEFYKEDEAEDLPVETKKVDKKSGEILEPTEKTDEEPKEEPEKDMSDDDYDDIFKDMED